MNDKISVIIPVYNMIDYIDDCMESVLSQTHENLEIILVDDGSIDSSGQRCDDYARKDQRVTVLHLKNGGLSFARNEGLSVATGDYIGFVDSDDTIEKNMYEVLLRLCKEDDTALSAARYDLFGDIETEIVPDETGERKIIDGTDFLKNILTYNEESFSTMSVWDRLYRKDIIQGLKFPEGKFYEEIVWSTKAFLKAEKISYINMSLYHYRIRKGSTSHVKEKVKYDRKLITDRLVLQEEQIRYLDEIGERSLANIARGMYFQEMQYIDAINDKSEFQHKISQVMKDWRLSLMDVLKLNIDGKLKRRLAIKMLFPLVVKAYYRNRQEK